MKGGETNSLWMIFRWPLLLALTSTAGLLSALVGDGAWDTLSWLLLAAPVACVLVGLLRR